MSPECIRVAAAKDMESIFWFHMRLLFFLICMDVTIMPASLVGRAVMPVAAFCNAFCLAERFWDVQLKSLVYWDPFCQCVFLVSRLVLMTTSILVLVLGTQYGLEQLFGAMSVSVFVPLVV